MARFLVKSADGDGYFHCDNPEVVLSAESADELEALVLKVEALQRDGYFIGGYLSYEAASGFDARCRTHNTDHFPLAVMLASRSVDKIELPEPASLKNPLSFTPRITEEDYDGCYARLLDFIYAGDIYQANYSFRVDLDQQPDGFGLFCSLEYHHPTPYAAYIEFEDWQIASSSPELFLQRQGDLVRTEPMKGTSPRGLWYEQDQANGEFLRQDKKNRAENLMIVDLMRNDVSKVCAPNSVHVPTLFESKRFHSLHQMVSTVEGKLLPEASLFDVLCASFPAGSITGAPKIRAMEVIHELETDPRHIYTGSMGIFFPGGDFQLNVAIRTVLLNQSLGITEFGIGSGVVSHSSAQAEWQECLLKGEFLNYRARHGEVFETLLWDGEYLWLDEHIARLHRSCEYFLTQLDPKAVRERLELQAQNFDDRPHRVRLAVERRGAIKIQPTRLDQRGWPEDGIKVCISDEMVDKFSCYQYHKTDVRNHYDKGLAQSVELGFHEVLFFNSSGYLAEGAITNVMLQVGEEWLTPSIECGLLPGIWRQRALLEFGAKESKIDRATLLEADRIIIGNSVRLAGEVSELWQADEKIWSAEK
jgi:para-aminobenzoate synthetase/4-amino-4-deoxychorismate lyase